MVPYSDSFDWSIASLDPSVVADDVLASLDIAQVNLACAKDLPGSEQLDVDASLEKIDDWSEQVRHATSRNYDCFLREPHLFDHSLGKFYMAVLCTTLQRDCGVNYNPERARDPGDARDARDRFIHGITLGAGGTCASLPVLYAAVGRRLGYPLRIVQGARHLFLRWDESPSSSTIARDRFNIEATATGFVSHPDQFYQQWPFPHSDPDIDPRYYLRSLTPREELAIFMCIRSIVLMDNGKFVQAIQPAGWARQLAPGDYSIKVHLELTMLLALGILDQQPPWVDAAPVIRPDGAKWNRYWWPRPMENRELLPAAVLPGQILARILPNDSPNLEVGDLADALYGRTHQYADDAFVAQVQHAAIAEQEFAEVMYHNAMNRARQQAMIDEMLQSNPTSRTAGPFPYHPVPAEFPVVPGVRLPKQFAQAMTSHGRMPMLGNGQPSIPGFGSAVSPFSAPPTFPPVEQLVRMYSHISLTPRPPQLPMGAQTVPPNQRIG